MKTNELKIISCETIPDKLEEGSIYVSEIYDIAIHLCTCGCKRKTVTPIGNGEWSITINESKATLRPSIGNFKGENPYHAHYYITNGIIEWL